MSSLAPGESGPRRSTQEPRAQDESGANETPTHANAASDVAIQMGGDPSEPLQPRPPFSPEAAHSRIASYSLQEEQTGPSYQPPTTSTVNMKSLEMEQIPSAQSKDSVHSSQRTPHYDGPYYVQYREDGSSVRKRWYGRSEDGYLAWTSVYLHEYFGFTIYHPLSPDEQFELKKDVDHMPPWIHEFTALPNLARQNK